MHGGEHQSCESTYDPMAMGQQLAALCEVMDSLQDEVTNTTYEEAARRSGAHFFALLRPVYLGFVEIVKRAEREAFLAYLRQRVVLEVTPFRAPQPLYELPRPPSAPLAPPL